MSAPRGAASAGPAIGPRRRGDAGARAAALAALVVVCAGAGTARASDDDSGRSATVWQAELKRQATDRGTESESTKTTLRIEALSSGPISQLRLDVPLPDEKQSFSGDPFDPHLGDVKVKVGFRAVPVGGVRLGSYVEVSFPTASPESLGSGKYQLTLGVRSTVPWTPWAELSAGLGDHRWTIAWLVEQVMSVAGAADRPDVNYTKIELGLLDTLPHEKTVKLTMKPAIDWEKDGRTGAVLELEGGMPIGEDWRAILMLGGRLWGEGVKSTYGRRAELTARYRF